MNTPLTPLRPCRVSPPVGRPRRLATQEQNSSCELLIQHGPPQSAVPRRSFPNCGSRRDGAAAIFAGTDPLVSCYDRAAVDLLGLLHGPSTARRTTAQWVDHHFHISSVPGGGVLLDHPSRTSALGLAPSRFHAVLLSPLPSNKARVQINRFCGNFPRLFHRVLPSVH